MGNEKIKCNFCNENMEATEKLENYHVCKNEQLSKQDKKSIRKLIKMTDERREKELTGKYLVAKWGYSMILATWVKVVGVSPKSLVVEEVKGRVLTIEELAAHKLSAPGFLQYYTIPTDIELKQNIGGGEKTKAFRIYKRDTTYVGTPSGMHMKLYFELWDGQPEFEDHCD